MITVIRNGDTNFYWGLSTDVKPTGKGLNGSIFYEMDTEKSYIYDEETNAWRSI